VAEVDGRQLRLMNSRRSRICTVAALHVCGAVCATYDEKNRPTTNGSGSSRFYDLRSRGRVANENHRWILNGIPWVTAPEHSICRSATVLRHCGESDSTAAVLPGFGTACCRTCRPQPASRRDWLEPSLFQCYIARTTNTPPALVETVP
jgi:hypothetical protein